LVHRDVSPQNILVSYEGDVKLVDFGIAKASTQIYQTRAGILKGKYAYMSPEQAQGLPVDRRSDVFAVGILLFELTSGRRLFRQASEIETLKKVIECSVQPPSVFDPAYPRGLEAARGARGRGAHDPARPRRRSGGRDPAPRLALGGARDGGRSARGGPARDRTLDAARTAAHPEVAGRGAGRRRRGRGRFPGD